MYRRFIGIVLYVTILNSFFKKTIVQTKARGIYRGGKKKRFDFFLNRKKRVESLLSGFLWVLFFLAISCSGGLLRQCFQRWLAAVLSCPSVEPAGDGTGRLSYFNEGDLELAGGHLGHLDEESRLVAVVFDDVVVHVDEDPGERRGKHVRKWAQNMGVFCSQA